MSAPTTALASAATSARTSALPIPPAAPVTTATRPPGSIPSIYRRPPLAEADEADSVRASAASTAGEVRAAARTPAEAEASTTQRPRRGNRLRAARVTRTSPASARAPASTHPRAGASLRSASRTPTPRARSRPPRARASSRTASLSLASPTHGARGRRGKASAAPPTTHRAIPLMAASCLARARGRGMAPCWQALDRLLTGPTPPGRADEL